MKNRTRVLPFGDDIKKSRKKKGGNKEPEDVPEEEICIDPKLLRKLVEHKEKQDECDGERQSKCINRHRKYFYLRIHGYVLENNFIEHIR